MKEYLQSHKYIDSDHQNVIAYAKQVVGKETNPTKQIQLLFNHIRDAYSYYPFEMDLRHEALTASAQMAKPTGYCVTKALLLSACARVLGVPARVCFFIVKNHLGTGKLESALETDLIVFHGSSEVYLKDKWIKLVPAFDKKLCDKLGVNTIEFDGENDAIFQEYQPESGKVSEKTYMEYIKDYGSFEDFPYDLAKSDLMKYYPSAFDQKVPVEKRILFKHW